MKQVTVHTVEQQMLAEVLAKQFGYYLLLLGEIDHQVINTCPIACRMAIATHLLPNIAVVNSHWQALPFSEDSIDVIVLSHVLEQVVEPAAIIVECQRVLRHDGCMIILGQNPWRKSLSLQFKPMPLLRLNNILQEHNLICMHTRRFNFFSGRLLSTYLNKLATYCLPSLCRSYIVVAKKRSPSLTPLPISSWFNSLWAKKPVVPVAPNLHRKDHG